MNTKIMFQFTRLPVKHSEKKSLTIFFIIILIVMLKKKKGILANTLPQANMSNGHMWLANNSLATSASENHKMFISSWSEISWQIKHPQQVSTIISENGHGTSKFSLFLIHALLSWEVHAAVLCGQDCGNVEVWAAR